MGDREESAQNESKLSSSKAYGTSAASNPALALLDGLITSANKLEASSIHIYSRPKAKSCYFEVAGKLETTGKKFNNKILEELIDFIKVSANLERSELIQAQTSNLNLPEYQNINLTLLSSLESKTSHLILSLDTSVKPKAFEDLGFWGKSLEQLEVVLDSGRGIIVVDSADQYTLRSIINSCLSYLKQNKKVSSVSFDSSLIPDTDLRNHDRIFTKIDTETKSLANKVLASNPRVVAFLDPLNSATIEMAVEQSELGSLVFLTSSTGSVSAAIKKLLSISSSLIDKVALTVSASPIQTISSSNGSHSLDMAVIGQIENFFGLDLPESWRTIYAHAGIRTPEELLHLSFPLASEYGGLTNLIEVFRPTEDVIRILQRNPELTTSSIEMLAVRSGMLTKREDGLIKSLQKEVDLADVIDICK